MKLVIAMALSVLTTSIANAGPSGDLLRKVAAEAKTEQEINNNHWKLKQKEERKLANTKALFAIEIGDGGTSYNASMDIEN